MASTIAAAKACARTMLFESLKIQKFQGAIPHVVLLVDSIPCVQQKVLVEGYRQALEEFNGNACVPTTEQSSAGTLFVPLSSGAETPCGSSGLGSEAPRISYSVQPFRPVNFMEDVKQLQRVLRHCGDARLEQSVPASTASAAHSQVTPATPVWAADKFQTEASRVWPLMQPLCDVHEATGTADEQFLQQLHSGPLRELLGFVLIQRNAFQNEMRKYRLRLSLFDLGMRVVEHCHLESMSDTADALAASGDFVAALQDDQIFSYSRSCSFSPDVAQSLAKAIADTIDAHAWARTGSEALTTPHSEVAAASSSVPVPPSLEAAKGSADINRLFKSGSLALLDGAVGAEAAATTDTTTFHEYLQHPITQIGAPLRIICEDPEKVLTFGAGLEDCLMNTGHYPAADDADRNDVWAHRARFRLADESQSSAAGAEPATAPSQPEEKLKAEDVHGRLKKKEYLALLKQRGEKPNKKRQHESDEDEDGATCARGATMSSSIGGTFPIGEVISESFDLSGLNGSCDVFAYPDPFKRVAMSKPRPFTMTIEKGIVTKISDDAPEDFVDLLSLVRQTEGDCYVRELGIGLNPYVGMSHVLMDVTSFERQWGIHLSLGQRHPLFVKQRARLNPDGTVVENVHVAGPVLKRKAGKYHIDVFLTASKLTIGALQLDFTRGLAVA